MRIIPALLLISLIAACSISKKPHKKGGIDNPLQYEFQDTLIFGKRSHDVANYIIPVSSGGFLVAGYMTGDEEGHFQGVLIRLDENQDTLWMKKYGDQGDNRAWSVCETKNKEFIVTGFSNRFSGGLNDDVWMYRTDKNGKLLWESNHGGSGEDLSWDIKRTIDGNYVVAAQTNSKGKGNFDAWILKINGDGEILWERTYGSEGRERVFSITQGIKGTIYASGIYTPGPAKGPIDVYTLAVDSKSGQLLWEDYLDKGGDDTGHGVLYDKNGGVWVAGYTTSIGSGGQDGFLLRYLDGKVTNFYTYGGVGNDRIMNVVYGEGGSLWLIGYSNSYFDGLNFDIWFSKTNRQGDLLFEGSFEGTGDDRGVHMLSDENKIILVGTYVQPEKENDPDLIILSLKAKN